MTDWVSCHLGSPVAHELVLPVRRDEADGVLRLKLAQLHALVELTVVYCDRRLGLGLLARLPLQSTCKLTSGQTAGSSHLAVHRNLVIDAELALRHPGQVGLHEDLAGHMGGQDLALRGHQQVDVLHHVEEKLIAAVLDALAPPPDLTSDLSSTPLHLYHT